MPLIPTLRRQRQEDHQIQTSTGYTMGSFNKERVSNLHVTLHVLLSSGFIGSIIKNHFKAISTKLGSNFQVAQQFYYLLTVYIGQVN